MSQPFLQNAGEHTATLIGGTVLTLCWAYVILTFLFISFMRGIVTNDPLGCFIFYFLSSRPTSKGVEPNSRGLIHDFAAQFKIDEMEKNMYAALQLTCPLQALAVPHLMHNGKWPNTSENVFNMCAKKCIDLFVPILTCWQRPPASHDRRGIAMLLRKSKPDTMMVYGACRTNVEPHQ